jgi:putative colanic acid biosynthesis acetyltransferase WcaF
LGRTDLARFNNSWYKTGGRPLKKVAWYFVNELVFKTGLLPINGLKTSLLRAFGARVGQGVVIKPCVNIKYPWRLTIGNHCWLGEEVWIDNLDNVTIGDHCCLSQGAMLLCGSHNYKLPTFDLLIGPITLEDGAWVGAKALVCPNVTLGSHAVLAAGSVATQDLPAYTISQGNPAVVKRGRVVG